MGLFISYLKSKKRISKDYDITVRYHPGNANVVADALSRLSMGSVVHVEEERKELVNDVHMLDRLGFHLISILDYWEIVQNGAKSFLVVEVKESNTVTRSCLNLRAQSIIKEWIFSPRGRWCATKMCRNQREVYWWNDMKGDIADYVSKCPNCQHVKVEHQKPGGSKVEKQRNRFSQGFVEESVTWDAEAAMKSKYPYLFPSDSTRA
ncbi:uncharacterized protein [Solanum lycopersicum]|uniref:uncharacterized protein n=1 Tax=Solanum lycopersicum TaxID=4081 RepID=UPI003748E61F